MAFKDARRTVWTRRCALAAFLRFLSMEMSQAARGKEIRYIEGGGWVGLGGKCFHLLGSVSVKRAYDIF